MKRRLIALLVALTSLFAGRPVHASVGASVDVSAAEQLFLDLLNADRITAGLPALTPDPRLADIARWRSEDMVARNYIGHDIGGYTVGRLLHDRSVPFILAGENIVSNTYGDSSTVARAQEELMRSAAHRENILRPEYNLVGVGVALGPNGRTVYTQIFIQGA
ncbi:MAG TPA: CAP domain-containing protein [Chloroflexota bacterium]|nr:CAP domain-containing protein [Chloroflexota bacterium]